MIIEKLDHLTLLKINGEDAASFLQGQLTNDIELASKKWQLSGYCTPKGRLLALLTIWRTNEDIYALIDSSLVESTLKRLRMYVMRSKVTIEEIESHQYAILEPSQKELLTHGFINTEITDLENHEFVTQVNTAQANTHCLSFGNRYLIVSTQLINSDLINRDIQQHWLQENITTGLPNVNIHSTDLFIPQMLNLDVLNGINFKKGCYTGQEIVARMHYLGKLKQRMFVCTLNTKDGNSNDNNEVASEQINSGDKIYSDSSMESSVGNIVCINANSALAVLRLDRVKEINQNNEVFRVNELTTLQINKSQPYSLNIK